MTVSKKDRSRTLALVKDVAECELDFNIDNVCAVLGCDWRFPKYSWQRIAELMDTDASDGEGGAHDMPDERRRNEDPTAVRCRDCASIKPTTDGRRYCKRWSHIVPLDGFCWRGESKSGEEAQEG